MYTTQFEVHRQVLMIREMLQLFKQNVLKYLERLEAQFEIFFVDMYRENLNRPSGEITNGEQLEITDDNDVSTLIHAWNKKINQKDDQYFQKSSEKLFTKMKQTITSWDCIISDLLNYHEKNQAFHGQYKFQSIKVIDEMCIEQTQNQTYCCFALINQQLNPILKSTIQFLFPKFVGDIGVGICDLAIVKENAFSPWLNQTGNGAFVCFQDTYTINTEQEDLNWKTKGFKFGEKDVIEVSYDPIEKKVTWKKVNKPKEGYSTTLLNGERQLYFCVIVRNQGAKVAIVHTN